jgi:two-component system, NtrC family, sensor kinase
VPKASHKQRADRSAFLLQLVRDLDRFAPDEEADRILRYAHRGIGNILQADYGYVWRIERGAILSARYSMTWTAKGQKLLSQADTAKLVESAAAFARDRKSPEDPNLLFTIVESAGRPIGILAFIRPARRFGRGDAHLGQDAAEFVGRHLTHAEKERFFEIRERIVRKVLLQLRPADILYQVLHGLKRLLQYDHSASVATYDPRARSLTIRAETIAWTKGKSERIGRKIDLDPASAAFLEGLEGCCVCGPDGGESRAPLALARPLTDVAQGAPAARSLIIAPLGFQDRRVGILTICGMAPRSFTSADIQAVDSFLHILSAAAVHAEFFRRQQDRLLEAERRTALGDLARAISHDLNNAFGVIQPLLQTVRRDVEEGTFTARRLKEDLDTLSQYVAASLRIFERLLSFARGSTEGIAAVDIAAATTNVLSLLARGLEAARIAVVLEIPEDLPRPSARRQDIEQLLLNLITNAEESMERGGVLTVKAWAEGEGGERTVRIAIEDTGHGIPPDVRARIFEPFFTTKADGTGLGLDICRSIVWEYNGALWLEPNGERGTIAQIRLPLGRRFGEQEAS